jgi:hypothetical protein
MRPAAVAEIRGAKGGIEPPTLRFQSDALPTELAGTANQEFANHSPGQPSPLTISKIAPCTLRPTNSKRGHSMYGKDILENVRRFRTIASLCRQTAAFRPTQKWSLLAQAYEWERLAMTELEPHFAIREQGSPWEMAAAA